MRCEPHKSGLGPEKCPFCIQERDRAARAASFLQSEIDDKFAVILAVAKGSPLEFTHAVAQALNHMVEIGFADARAQAVKIAEKYLTDTGVLSTRPASGPDLHLSRAADHIMVEVQRIEPLKKWPAPAPLT
jgi:hypothetical protein